MSLARDMMVAGFNLPDARGRDLELVCEQLGLRREGEPFRVRPMFAWYDLWVGAFWDQRRRRLYVMLLPTLGFHVQFSTLESDDDLRARATAHVRAL